MIKSNLHIQGLKLPVNLGWPENEREQEQIVLLDLEIAFFKPPLACTSDNLEDTVCYSILIQTLREKLSVRNFHLIEHLGHEIYSIVKEQFPPDAKITIHVTKKPKIKGLTGGVCFSYYDAR